jgi:hypothetical protein
MDGSFAKYVTWTGGYIFMYPSPRRSSLEGTTKDHDVRMNDVMFGLFAHWTVRMTPQVPIQRVKTRRFCLASTSLLVVVLQSLLHAA